MKKIDLNFGKGKDSVVFSIKGEKFFSYELDGEELHRLKEKVFWNLGIGWWTGWKRLSTRINWPKMW